MIASFCSNDISRITQAAYNSLNINYEEDIPLGKVDTLIKSTRIACDFMFKHVTGKYAPSTLQITDIVHRLYYSLVEYASQVGVIDINTIKPL